MIANDLTKEQNKVRMQNLFIYYNIYDGKLKNDEIEENFTVNINNTHHFDHYTNIEKDRQHFLIISVKVSFQLQNKK